MPSPEATPAPPLDADRQRVLDLFAHAWASGSPGELVATFLPVMDPDVRLVQWPMPPTRGHAGFFRFARGIFGLIDGLKGEVLGAAKVPTGMSVDLELTGDIAGRPVTLHSRDVFTLRGDIVERRRAHVAWQGTLRALAPPTAWPGATLATWRMSPLAPARDPRGVA